MIKKSGMSKIYTSIILVFIIIFSIGIVIVNANQGGGGSSTTNSGSSQSNTQTSTGVSHKVSEIEGLTNVISNLASSLLDEINRNNNELLDNNVDKIELGIINSGCFISGYEINNKCFGDPNLNACKCPESANTGSMNEIINKDKYGPYVKFTNKKSLNLGNNQPNLILCCKQEQEKIKIIDWKIHAASYGNLGGPYLDIENAHESIDTSRGDNKIGGDDTFRIDIVTNIPASGCFVDQIRAKWGRNRETLRKNIGLVNGARTSKNPDDDHNSKRWSFKKQDSKMFRGEEIRDIFDGSLDYDQILIRCTNAYDSTDNDAIEIQRPNNFGFLSYFCKDNTSDDCDGK